MSLTAAVKSKMLAKRDSDKEKAVLNWITEVTGDTFSPDADYKKVLRDGQSLCKLINIIQPGAIPKVHGSGPDFKLIENVNSFTKAVRAYGLQPMDIFQTTDLWEGKDISNVTATIFALGRQVHRHPEYQGPHLVPKPSE